MYDFFIFTHFAKGINTVSALRRPDSLYFGQRLHIVIRKPQAPLYFQIHKVCLIVISVSGNPHIRF